MSWLSKLSTSHKILISLSVPVTSVLLYLLLRGEEDDLDGDKQIVLVQHVGVEVAVPRDAVGAVIGPQGSKIKAIQEKTKTRVKFYDDRGSGKDRLLMIKGRADGVQQAELMIRQIIADQPPITTEILLVPQRAVGAIIGRNGETIRSMSEQSKAKISIKRTDAGIERTAEVEVLIRGSPTAVESAKILIEERVNDERLYIKRTVRDNQQSAHTQTFNSTHNTDTNQAAAASVLSESGGDVWRVGGDYTEVFVSAVEHPQHFWIQIISSQSVQLEQIITELTQLHNNHNNTSEDGYKIVIGELVAARFSADDRWYRARVLEVMDDSVDLYYVDFGDGGIVPKSSVRPLGDEYKELPYQAVECCLADVTSTSSDGWSEESIECFEELCGVGQWRSLMCRTVRLLDMHDGSFRPCVQIIDTNTSQDIDIGRELISRGFALRTEQP